ncbi:MAG: pseudouridine synthase [Candidatus Margulisiibacteriota bacterium]|nr:pseudouridine synthase [Candidatus Margulisiibacteriota bacterium]
MSEVRLQKYIAECGVASRRRSEKLIVSGKVKVNGEIIKKLGTKIDPEKDIIIVNGKKLKKKEKKIYIKLNKPRGIISSCSERGKKTVLDLISDIPYRLYPVGRLDADSQGLMILTNDGELANRLMHPRYEHEKEYQVSVRGPLKPEQIKKIKEGPVIGKEKTLPARIFIKGSKRFNIVLREGKNRQIRRMVEALGNEVVFLKRVRIKNIQLGNLKVGKYEYLTRTEIRSLNMV